MPWSDDVRVMVSPFRTYRELAKVPDENPWRTAVGRVAFLLLFIATFVSFISAGRLVAFHVASTMVFWAFVPAIQAAVFTIVLRLLGSKGLPGFVKSTGKQGGSVSWALGLYFTGHGPWFFFFLFLVAVCFFAPDVYATMMWMVSHGVLPLLLLGSWVWSGVLTFACFRAGLGFSRGRASGATALFYLGYAGTIVGYYLAMNQIQPQVPWAK